MPLSDAKAKLQTISGVGPKVADCALLYGLHRTECFPMDVWMKRAVLLLPSFPPQISVKTPASRSNIYSTMCACTPNFSNK